MYSCYSLTVYSSFQAKKSIDIMQQKLKTLDSSQNTFLQDIDKLNSMLDEMLDIFGLN